MQTDEDQIRHPAQAMSDAIGMRTRAGWQLPGIANLHSHAFQRTMAGLTERRSVPGTNAGTRSAQTDSFWTWRETMYRFASRFDPDTLLAVASQLYAEMLEAGYTAVCEFHYLHHAPDGAPYPDPTAMSDALIEAARRTGIRLTLLPVLYMSGGFDGRPLSDRQRRFGHDIDGYLRLFEALQARQLDPACEGRLRVGCALHSLRAVPADAMRTVLSALPGDARIHVHIAEQIGEVEECIAVRGARPVAWLLANAQVDARWTLVHATHLDENEIAGIARSGATVAICPTTEANLGDGLFPLRRYLDAKGAWGIGSDSHVSVSPVEELRWLEYGQRLVTRHRNIAVAEDLASVGDTLLRGVVASAAAATGFAGVDDHVLLDADAPMLAGANRDDVVDRWIFAGNRNLVREVQVAGRQVVGEGRHRDGEAIAVRYREAMAALLD
jgi:formimidoylglutamate deiminase